MSELSSDFKHRLQAKVAADARAELERAMRGESPTGPLATFLPVERGTLDDKAAGNLRTMVFTSSSGGEPHIVTRLEDGRLVCTCPAFRKIETQPSGCWAMKNFRSVAGMQQ